MNSYRLKIITTLIVLTVLSFVIVNCVESPFGPKLDSFEFPLTIGNYWDYAITIEQSFYDTSHVLTSVDSLLGSSRTTLWPAISTPEIPYPYGYLTRWQFDQFNTGSQSGFFHNEADGLYISVSNGTWNGPPKIVPGQSYYEFKGVKANSIKQLTDYFIGLHKQITAFKPNGQLDTEDRPVRNWAYPLEVGTEWLYRDTEEGDLFDIQKRVIGTERVTVPAGKFDCYKVKWQWDANDDGEWDTDIEAYDYISEVGTIRRVLVVRGIAHRNYENQSVDMFDAIEDYSLTDYAVQ